MRQVPNGKRSRNRPGRNNNRPQQSRNHSYDSSGPEGKVRGTANQVYDKYLALARDASSSGDRVTAENYFQHAEHYFRIMNVNGQQVRPRSEFGDDENTEAGGDADGPAQPQPRVEPPRNEQPRVEQPSAVAPSAQASSDNAPAPAPEPVVAKPETPAELAQAAAANEGRPAPRPRRRGPRSSAGKPVEA